MFLQKEPSSRAPEARQEAEQPKEPPRGSTDRASRKRKAESGWDVFGSGAAAPAESGTGPFPGPPLRIRLSRLWAIEAELICADEADTEFGCGEPLATAVPPGAAAARPPAETPGDGRGHRFGLQAALLEGCARYRRCDFAPAAAKFSAALELRSKGFATEDLLKSSPDDLSRLSSWIESMLVICYLKLGQPVLALHHSHRSIIQNPSNFCNHLRQAVCFRYLHRYSEAARSAMLAHCLYVLAEDAELETSNNLQLYWQAMIQEALNVDASFSALYTPFEKENKADKIKEANKTFAEKHPDYVQHIFTDPHGIHLLPEKAESHPGQQYLLTLGFRNKEIGKAVEKFVTRKYPVFPGQKVAFNPGMAEQEEIFWQNTWKRIMAATTFIGSTKIKDERGPCARAIEQFHHASMLSRLRRGEEQAQVMTQAMAELATAPYLHRVSQEDKKLLQSLMADAVDILAGRTGERAWMRIQKVALIEEYLREGEEFYLRIPRVRMPGMGNIHWTPRGQKYMRLENTNMFIPNPRSLATGLKKDRIFFTNS